MNDIIKSDIKKLSFIQLIRLLRLSENDINLLFRKLNITPNLSLEFTTCDFEEIKFENSDIKIIANFLSTYGTSSVLPTFYTEELLKYKHEENNTLREFYNIFNRRTYQLLGETLIKNRLMLRILEFNDKKALDYIYSFIGLNYTDNKNLKYINKFKLLKYIDILNNSSKSTNMLEIFLSDYLNIKIKIQEYLKVKVPIPKNQLNSLKKRNTSIGTLYLGKRINNTNSSFKIILQNLNEKEFDKFLPGEMGFSLLQELIKLYFGNNYFNYVIDYRKDSKILNLKKGFYLNKQSRLGMNINLGQHSNYIYNRNNLNLL
jgi:type VI secretion system protein ImpH